MPQEERISRKIKFVGDAKHKQNIGGPFHEEMVHFHDHFTDDTLSTDKWAVTEPGNTDACAVEHTAYPGGMCRITTGATHDDTTLMETPLMWEDDQNCVAEARVLLADVDGVAFYFGFADSTSVNNGDCPIDYQGTTLAATDTEAAGFICDADDTVNGVSSIMCVAVNTGGLETAVDSGTDWADGKWHTLRVELDPDGDAYYYLDGVSVGHIAEAITSGTHLCVMAVGATRAAAASDYIYIDRIDIWQDEVPNA